MDTVSILMAQYGGKAVVPLDIVCRDYFAPLTVPTLVRKISAGEIGLPLIGIEHSRKSAKGVRIQDLAHYIDTRPTVGAEQVKAGSAVARPDNAAPEVERSSDRQPAAPEPVAPSVPPPEKPGTSEPTLERALTLQMAADLLSVSYSTVYAHKEEMGFFQIGNQWRVWPSTLKARLAAKQEAKASTRETSAVLSSKGRVPSHALSPNARKAETELDRRLRERLSRPPKRR